MAMMEHHEYEYFNATGEDDNEGAPHYAQFVDPSPYLFLMTLVFCVAVNAILCFAVKAREKRRREQSQNNQKKIEEASSTSSDDTGFSDEVDDNSKSPPPSSYTVPSSKMLVISPTTPSLNTLGFEAVLKKHRPRRRGCARLRLAMQKMEVIYQAAEIDEQDDLSLAADESQKNGDYDDSSATGSSSNRVVEVVLTEEDQDWLNAKYTSPATKDQKDDSRKCDVYSKRMLEIAKWDTDMKRIFRLGIPFVVEATMEAGIEILTMAIVGKLIGTEELSAFVTVSLLMGMTDHIVGGIHESLVTLCPHAMSINKRLVGEYVQLSIVFCVLLTIPLSVFWYYFIDEALEWLGFDEETVKIGHDYAMILVFDLGLMGIGESIHALLDTINLESYSTMLVVAEDLSGFLLILLLALFDHPDLNTVGLVHLFCHVFFMGLNVIIILRKGWFDPYMDGILGSSALRNTKAIQLMLKTGLALSVGYISTEGEVRQSS